MLVLNQSVIYLEFFPPNFDFVPGELTLRNRIVKYKGTFFNCYTHFDGIVEYADSHPYRSYEGTMVKIASSSSPQLSFLAGGKLTARNQQVYKFGLDSVPGKFEAQKQFRGSITWPRPEGSDMREGAFQYSDGKWKLNGPGTHAKPNGDVFKGFFVNDLLHG